MIDIVCKYTVLCTVFRIEEQSFQGITSQTGHNDIKQLHNNLRVTNPMQACELFWRSKFCLTAYNIVSFSSVLAMAVKFEFVVVEFT